MKCSSWVGGLFMAVEDVTPTSNPSNLNTLICLLNMKQQFICDKTQMYHVPVWSCLRPEARKTMKPASVDINQQLKCCKTISCFTVASIRPVSFMYQKSINESSFIYEAHFQAKNNSDCFTKQNRIKRRSTLTKAVNNSVISVQTAIKQYKKGKKGLKSCLTWKKCTSPAVSELVNNKLTTILTSDQPIQVF